MFKIAFDANKFTKELNTLQAYAKTYTEDVAVPYYFQKLQSILPRALQIGKQQIRDAVTKTGQARAARGEGEAGRVESHQFIDGLQYNVMKTAKGTYLVRYGWLNGEPNWASYQELGFVHSGGMIVTGADALGAMEMYIESEIDKLR